MEVIINVRNLELTERLKEYVEKRVSRLDRYLDVLDEAIVDLRVVETARSAADRQIAQLTVRGKSVVLRAEDRADDIYPAVDSVLEKVERQIERYKGRRWKSRGDGRSMGELLARDEQESDEAGWRIARRKRHQLQPMSELEAIEQMRLLEHEDFFIFLNEAGNRVNLLYRRRDGALGLIESEIA